MSALCPDIMDILAQQPHRVDFRALGQTGCDLQVTARFASPARRTDSAPLQKSRHLAGTRDPRPTCEDRRGISIDAEISQME